MIGQAILYPSSATAMHEELNLIRHRLVVSWSVMVIVRRTCTRTPASLIGAGKAVLFELIVRLADLGTRSVFVVALLARRRAPASLIGTGEAVLLDVGLLASILVCHLLS